jgi:Ser/Thr protein kinase RdoA (MazF antagonist)
MRFRCPGGIGAGAGYAEAVHGIPGFAGKADVAGWETPAAFERITPDAALAIGRDIFALDVRTVARLETERDDTFRLRTPGRDLVLKVAHPADSAVAIDLQTRALQFAQSRDAELPLQHFVESSAGEIAPALAAHHNRIARVLTWLPGTLLQHATPSDDQVAALGEALGRLSTALRGFEHAASVYPMAWDLAQAHKLRAVAELFPDALVAEALDRFDHVVLPICDELPHQVIHNDFNPGNVVVDPDGPVYVTGILDFGDVIHSLRIADLAVALSYQLFPLGRTWPECAAFIEGFERKVLLLPLERAVLKTLVATRFAQRILINDWLTREGTGRPVGPELREGARAALDELL